jgi:outer membrane receptor protein involved in Fe transport
MILCWMGATHAAAQAAFPDAGALGEPQPTAPDAPPEATPDPAITQPQDAGDAGLPPVSPSQAAPATVAAPPAPADPPVEAPMGKGPGTLQGTLKGAEDGMALDGADIYVRGEPYQTRSDANGKFRLALPSGTYQISVIYPGFSTLTVSKVEVRAGKLANLNLELHSGSEVLDEYVITGSRVQGGIATLIAERRDSSAVADVIGSEQMARSGDANAAAALARVTGITVVDGKYVIVRGMGERYSSMTLNQLQVASPDPTRRVVPLDLFPAGVIESVVVQKTYSPDLPGEFGGGLVQLRSRDYPDKFLFSVNAATGGNTSSTFRQRLTYQGGDRDYLGVDDGTRALPSAFEDSRGRLELPNIANPDGGYSAEELEKLGEMLPNIYNTRREETFPDLTLVANVGDSYRLRRAKIGFVAAAGYKNEYRNVLNAINRVYLTQAPTPEQDYLLDTYRRQISLSGFLDWGVEFSKNHKLKATTMLLRQTDDTTQYREDVQAGGTRTTLSWVERQVLLQQISGFHKFERLRDFQLDWRYAFGQARRIEPDRRQYFYVPNTETGTQELSSAGNSNQRLYGDLKDDTHEAALDLSQPFDVWKRLHAKVKAGGLFYKRNRVADTRRFEFGVVDSDLDRAVDPEHIFTPENIGPSLEFREATLSNDNYDAMSQIEAGYGMIELPVLKSLELMGGARIEHARIESTTFDPFDDSLPATTSKLDNLDVLPAATVTWRFLEDFQLRGGYSRTLNRPDLREVSASRYYDLDTNLLYQGEPTIKRALIENVDARFEWYLTPDEVFSIGGFMKDFTDPIETYLIASSEEVYSVKNEDHARSYGLELEGRKHFGFLSNALDALYIASNFSLITSTVEVALMSGDTYERPLQGQSPWVINAQLGWDDSGDGGTGTAASLLFNSAGRRIRVIGDPDMNQGDIYELPIYRMDFVVSQDLPQGFKIGARARNLLNAKETWVRDGKIWREQRRGADLQLSVSWSY